ncbi:hypothetical protein N0B51_09490 [Tsuneonella sp. YG55]|uniref:Uncharacterized protein n=1 Tax=Tsuneonella litorea TaxID=2976475 RepID=A0A9X3A892_9SPHN|nr:hypothetical protein [Tsuneonella litorea]MCT2559216.1 hypothetical protein [Tsuneonella litorea]
MTRAARLFCVTALAVPAAALAQVNADKARLDDFAAPGAPGGVEIGQIAAPRGPVIVEQEIDRALPAPPTPAAPRQAAGGTQQISRGEAREPVGQVAPAGERSAQAAPALSRREDGRRSDAAPVGGNDRCDPQAGTEREMAICRRILELRAREFSATEAPRLSPEQELLAREAHSDRVSLVDLAGRSGANRPLDAEERAAQELGFLTLPSPMVPPVEEELPDASLSDAVKAVLVQMGVPGP